MNRISHPPFWTLFGFIYYPILCLIDAWLTMTILFDGGYLSKSDIPSFGLNGFIALSFGIPLGLISRNSAQAWQNNCFPLARWTASVGGAVMLVPCLLLLRSKPPLVWLAESGFVLPPLVWSACLILFGVYTRTPKTAPVEAHETPQ